MGKKNKFNYDGFDSESFMNDLNGMMDGDKKFDFLKPKKKKEKKANAFDKMMEVMNHESEEKPEEPETEDVIRDEDLTLNLSEILDGIIPYEGDEEETGILDQEIEPEEVEYEEDSEYEEEDVDEDDFEDPISQITEDVEALMIADYETDDATIFNGYGEDVATINLSCCTRGFDESYMENEHDTDLSVFKRALMLIRKPNAILDGDWVIQLNDGSTLSIDELLSKYDCTFGGRAFWIKLDSNTNDPRDILYLFYYRSILEDESIDNLFDVYSTNKISIQQAILQLSQQAIFNPTVSEVYGFIYQWARKTYIADMTEDIALQINQLMLNELMTNEFKEGPTHIESCEEANERPSMVAFLMNQKLDSYSDKLYTSSMMKVEAGINEKLNTETADESEDVEDISDADDILPSREEAINETKEKYGNPEKANEEVSFGGEEKKSMVIDSMPKPN